MSNQSLHFKRGLFFTRLPDGSVELVKRSSPDVESEIQFQEVISANDWTGIVATLSKAEYGSELHNHIRELHMTKPVRLKPKPPPTNPSKEKSNESA